MNGETKLGLGLASLLVLCCGGPLVLSLVASGAAMGAIGAVWADGRPLLLAAGALLIVISAWLLARRYRANRRVCPRADDA